MVTQKEIIDLIESLDYRKKPSNPKQWFKPIKDLNYIINMTGKEPILSIFQNGEEIFDDTDTEFITTQAAIDILLGKDINTNEDTNTPETPAPETKTKPASKAKPTPETETNNIECELCHNKFPVESISPVGYPFTHDVCPECAEKITSGKINVNHWYPDGSETPAKETGITPDAIPEETLAEPPELDDNENHESPDLNKGDTDEDDAKKQIPETNESIANNHIPKPIVKTIERVSSRICDIVPELAERGKIKIGGKGEEKTGKSGKSYRLPVKSDHFTIVTTGKDGNGDFIVDKQIMDTIGPNCTELDIMVLYNDPDLIFRTSYAFFNSSKCECRGDGVTAITLKGDVIECDPKTCETFKEKGCKPNGVLSVILMDAPRVGGVYKFRTTSWNTIRNITTSLDTLRSLTYGQLAGLPLVLTLQPKTTVIPGTSNTTVIYMANIEFKGSMNELLNKTMQIAQTNSDVMGEIKRIENNARLMLNAAPSPEECKEIVDEFYPDTVLKEIGA